MLTSWFKVENLQILTFQAQPLQDSRSLLGLIKRIEFRRNNAFHNKAPQ